MSTTQPPLIPDQRREQLVAMLRQQTVLSVHQLTELLGVSHMTVRRDIAALEREGRVFSVPGGARIASVRTEPSRADKSVTERAHKAAMANCVAEMIRDDMTIYLDAGTTLHHVAPLLRAFRGLTVLTNDFTTLDALVGTDVDLIHVGGRVEHRNRSAVGRLAAATLRAVSIDVSFVSASSWDLARGVTTPSEDKVAVKQAAMSVASTSVLVAGSSKYGTFSLYRVAWLEDFARVITDDGLPITAVHGLRDRGVDLVLAPTPNLGMG
ncbi:DeoR/GlpR transcriptional regulator [Phytoactinopolyspora alkaliphila]|uniref:DeoR/GlpR transcriptional regulator n=1 Tax=Phytoactinopolyspora alkaliphila TaxID=1783498 RepID=A0A6N9YNS9_9ACTN|nr:DeoR/GlpR family DNA-binding transcription regulator [Phytoactinopolyspora alkaliphila]NED96696.1 DeoR/GlpR transcriptional regulator [Phytoactinopolyspora alkaliphila]